MNIRIGTRLPRSSLIAAALILSAVGWRTPDKTARLIFGLWLCRFRRLPS
jgi:hypothetical protein